MGLWRQHAPAVLSVPGLLQNLHVQHPLCAACRAVLWLSPPPCRRLAASNPAPQEEQQREREERERAAAERAARLEADRKRRAAESKKLRKKTHGGQPVMKYRIEKMLQQLGGA